MLLGCWLPYRPRGKFTLAKTKENGKALKDATFKIWSAGNDPEGKPIKFSVTKKTDDKAMFDDINDAADDFPVIDPRNTM